MENNEGAFSFENWKGFLTEKPLEQTIEYPLFTDAYITGELTEGLGPYQLLMLPGGNN